MLLFLCVVCLLFLCDVVVACCRLFLLLFIVFVVLFLFVVFVPCCCVLFGYRVVWFRCCRCWLRVVVVCVMRLRRCRSLLCLVVVSCLLLFVECCA